MRPIKMLLSVVAILALMSGCDSSSTKESNATSATSAQDENITKISGYISRDGVEYGVIESISGRKWLDRAVGAKRACTSYTDTECYGGFFQYGRYNGRYTAYNMDKTLDSSHIERIPLVNVPDLVDAVVIPLDWEGKHVDINDPVSADWTTDDPDGAHRFNIWADSTGQSVCPKGFRVPTRIDVYLERGFGPRGAFGGPLLKKGLYGGEPIGYMGFSNEGYRSYNGELIRPDENNMTRNENGDILIDRFWLLSGKGAPTYAEIWAVELEDQLYYGIDVDYKVVPTARATSLPIRCVDDTINPYNMVDDYKNDPFWGRDSLKKGDGDDPFSVFEGEPSYL